MLIGYSLSAFSQYGKQIFSFNKFKVFKSEKNKTYTILNSRNRAVLKNLKYVNYAGYSNHLQVVDKKNHLFYLNDSLKKTSTPKEEMVSFCGTVASFKRKIIEDSKNYFVEFTEDNSVYNEGVKVSIVDTIPKKDVKNIYFSNKKKEIHYDENFYLPTYLILDLGDKVAIKQGDSTKYYDSIDLSTSFPKVKRDSLVGYYGITEVKYRKIGKFEYNLAKFEDKNGNIGYIDLQGKEY